MANNAIAAALGIDANKVGRWRTRCAQEGPSAIERERPRGANHSGKDSRAQAALRTRVIEATTQAVPEDATHWSCRSMARHLGTTHSFVNRVRRAHGLRPHLIRTFRLSSDPRFEFHSAPDEETPPHQRHHGVRHSGVNDQPDRHANQDCLRSFRHISRTLHHRRLHRLPSRHRRRSCRRSRHACSAVSTSLRNAVRLRRSRRRNSRCRLNTRPPLLQQVGALLASRRGPDPTTVPGAPCPSSSTPQASPTPRLPSNCSRVARRTSICRVAVSAVNRTDRPLRRGRTLGP